MPEYQHVPEVLTRFDHIVHGLVDGFEKVTNALGKFTDSSERLLYAKQFVATLSASVAAVVTTTERLSDRLKSLECDFSALREDVNDIRDASAVTSPSPDESDTSEAARAKHALAL